MKHDLDSIISASRFSVKDNGFTEKVMFDIKMIEPPTKSSYITPTLIVAACSLVAMIAICMFVDICAFTNEVYDLSSKIVTLHK